MTEQEQAFKIAEMWLDGRMNKLVQMVPGDPDCDACVLARQYQRSIEALERLERALHASAGFNLAFRKPQGRATTKTRERPSYEYPE